MVGRSYNIHVAEGGFIVYINEPYEGKDTTLAASLSPRVFVDSTALINFLHNELVGSN